MSKDQRNLEDPDQRAFERIISDFRTALEGQTVILLVRNWGGVAISLIREIESSGGRVGAVICGEALSIPPEYSEHVRPAMQGWNLDKLAFDKWVEQPGSRTSEWLNKLDPQCEWKAVGPPGCPHSEFLDRVFLGAIGDVAVLEDKTKIDRVFEGIGIPSPSYSVVDNVPKDIIQATSDLFGPLGVILAIDNETGVRGDAKGLFWIRTLADLSNAIRNSTSMAKRVRVSKFEKGIPISTLGMCLSEGVAVFDPLEIVTLIKGRNELVFCGSSTHWRPPENVRQSIHLNVKMLGNHILKEFGYRGLFSLDGIWTAQGFLATEVNPRHASGLGVRHAFPEIPLDMLNRLIKSRMVNERLLRPHWFEKVLRARIAERPSFSIEVPISTSGLAQTGERWVNRGGQEVRVAWTTTPYGIRIRQIEPIAKPGLLASRVAETLNLLDRGSFSSYETI